MLWLIFSLFFIIAQCNLPPEEEFCNQWLPRRCGYFNSMARPVEDPTKDVEIIVGFSARRFMTVDDVVKTFKIQGLFEISWQLPKCALFNEKIALAENVSAAAAKTKMCKYSTSQMWTPEIFLSNTYEDPMIIIKFDFYLLIFNTCSLFSFVIFSSYQRVMVYHNNPAAIVLSTGLFEAIADLDFAVRFLSFKFNFVYF